MPDVTHEITKRALSMAITVPFAPGVTHEITKRALSMAITVPSARCYS